MSGGTKRDIRNVLDALLVFAGVIERDGTLVEVNRAALETARREAEEVVGRKVWEAPWFAYDEQVAARVRDGAERAAGGERVRFDVDVRVTGGRLVAIELQLLPVRDERGAVEYVVLSAVDVSARKESEEALRHSEAEARRRAAELEATYRTAPIGLCVVDRELRWVRINERLAEMNGVPAAAHLGRRVRDVLPGIADQAESILRHVLDTGEPVLRVELEGETPAQPGVMRSWVESFYPIRDETTGTVVAVNVVAQETTEARRVQRALHESDERLRLAATAAGFGTFEVREDKCAQWSPELRRIVGLPEVDEPITIGVLERLLHPDDRARVLEEIAQSVDPRGDGVFESEHRFVRPDGSVAWVLARGRSEFRGEGDARRFVHASGAVIDLSARKALEQERQRDDARWRLTIEASGAADWEYWVTTGELRWSERMLELWGATPESTLEEALTRLHPDDVVRSRAAFERSLDPSGDGMFLDESRVLGTDGKVHWLESRGRTTFEDTPEGRRPVVLRAVTLDVSERKRAEEDRARLLESERRAREDAERASRMRDEFLATISHELRTPLNAILGWAHLLRSGPDDRARLERGLDVITRNAQLQATLIADLLDMSRIIAGKLALEVHPLDPSAAVSAALESVRAAASAKEITLRTVVDSPVPRVRGDATRLQQVIWNLLSNAIKFTPRGGRVEVSIARRDDEVEIAVADSGQGIDPEFLPHVFERFRQADQTTTRRHGGLGLGLAIVQQIVQMHGGTVRAESEGVGKGARFAITLPATAREVATTPATERAKRGPDALRRLGGVRVLVVDDEPDARDVIAQVLELAEADVSTASSADEALEVMERAPFDVLLSDIGMPKRDGYALIEEVRRRGIAVPAAALTAFARDQDRKRALAAGYQVHIPKPVEPEALISAVASLATVG
ncbi:PAS domain S-box protein [Sandaracinus amylolyticus]|uniref:histidine kinase n=1 Tax=Sandaracinus amylolyticus TaxID=927083 RepID=A0A0F6W7D1_9BACT|nr:PAS domain S-box protein [Sandaracinus amylolyticus]AKF09375.1 Chemotaxis protein methyltransferase CheR [Sandaracinus amylolyticus]